MMKFVLTRWYFSVLGIGVSGLMLGIALYSNNFLLGVAGLIGYHMGLWLNSTFICGLGKKKC